MATTVTYNGTQYSVPAYQDTGYAQGAGNLSSFLVALATGSLTLAGGTFTLTADADFGANFGLKAAYYKTRSTNLASAGNFRMANGDIIAWRNQANSGNLTMTTDSTDAILTNTAFTITPTSNQLNLGTTRLVTITAPTPASSSRTWTIPDITSNGTFAALEGTQTFTGNKTFSGTVSIANTKLQIGGNQALPVLQIVTGATNANVNSTTNVYATTGLAATITPKFNTSKIKVTVHLNVRLTNAASGNCIADVKLDRAGTLVTEITDFADTNIATNFITHTGALVAYDSPATTSSTTYTVYFKNQGANGTVAINPSTAGTNESYIILEEVAQ